MDVEHSQATHLRDFANRAAELAFHLMRDHGLDVDTATTGPGDLHALHVDAHADAEGAVAAP